MLLVTRDVFSKYAFPEKKSGLCCWREE